MRISIIIFSMLYIISMVQAQDPKGTDFHLLIGSYTSKEDTNGIHVYKFNSQSGQVGSSPLAVEAANASYLAVSKDKKNVYAVSESGGDKASVNAFSFNAVSGALTFQNSVPSQGDHPCYVAVDDKKKFVFVGNYSGGNLLSIPVAADGSLRSDVQNIKHEGSSVNKDRQDKPHVHSVVLSPDNRHLLVQDLGTDKVNVYKLDTTKPQALAPAAPPFTSTKPGGGPRHLTFHPSGKFAYLVLEMEAAVTAFDYKNGVLKEKQTITMLRPDFKGNGAGAADIHVSPDGKFLYASNRGDANEIVIYSIDKNGKLTTVGHQSILGKTPRNFALDPSGNFLLSANQATNEVVIFKRDQKSGLLTATGTKISVNKPVCLKFVAVAE
jgi:6-phosphogluconolactonase